MRCEDGDLVGAVDGKMGVDEDKEVGDGLGERQYRGQRVPCYRVCVKYYGEK
jgi:hypothetical protein